MILFGKAAMRSTHVVVTLSSIRKWYVALKILGSMPVDLAMDESSWASLF